MTETLRRGKGYLTAPKRFYQPIDFSGIKIGNIAPSDIDLLCEYREKFMVEYQNKAWLFALLKYRNADFPFGQKLAYERLVDDLAKINKPSISIVAEHSVDNPAETASAAKCVVREATWKGKWRKCQREPPVLLGDAIKKFISRLEATA